MLSILFYELIWNPYHTQRMNLFYREPEMTKLFFAGLFLFIYKI